MTDTKTMSDEELGTELWHLFASLGRRNPPTVADVLAKARSLLCASPAQPAPPQEPVCAACDAAVPREGPNALAVGEFRVCREHLENFEVRPASATFALYAYCVGRSGRPIPKREPFKHGGTVLMAPPQEPPASDTMTDKTMSDELTAEQAMGVALSIPMGSTEMGECQKLAPGVVKHLESLGWVLKRSADFRAAMREALADEGLEIAYRSNVAMLLHDRWGIIDHEARNQAAREILAIICRDDYLEVQKEYGRRIPQPETKQGK